MWNSVIRLHWFFFLLDFAQQCTTLHTHTVIPKTYLAHVQRDFERMKWCVFICLLFVLNFRFFVRFFFSDFCWLLDNSIGFRSRHIEFSRATVTPLRVVRRNVKQRNKVGVCVWFRIEIYLRYKQNEYLSRKKNIATIHRRFVRERRKLVKSETHENARVKWKIKSQRSATYRGGEQKWLKRFSYLRTILTYFSKGVSLSWLQT